MTIQEMFLKQKEALRARTKQTTFLLREDEMSWRPVPGALSVGEMLRHMWVSEEGVRRVALEGNFAYYETRIPQGLGAVVGKPRTLAEELQSLDKVHTETLAQVARFPLERWEEERVHEGLGIRRKIAVILFGINEHEVHHRAQLMTYLRMLGTPVAEPFARK
ncbi:MAG: DinB family protein [Candidatus Acidiferrales bacterium]